MMKFAILGAGMIANKMACTISHMPLVEAYAVAARNLDRATEFAARYGFAKAYESYEEMVEDREVDIVYIAVPHSLHYRYMKLCLEHGKHVLCEKPFTVNAEQTKKIIALAEKNGLLAAEAMWTRYMPSRKIVDDIIKRGVIGHVTSLTANLGYELSAIKNTEKVIIETIEKYGYTVMMILEIIVKNHGPFSRGEDAVISVYKAVVMEEVSNMDFRTLMLNPESNMAQYVLDKYYFRKHGPKAYYGQ